MACDYAILGGGPAGLAAAVFLHRAGFDFELFEGAPQVGGLCRTFTFEGHRYDSGAHRLHDKDPEVTSFLKQLMGEALRPVSRPSRVLMDGKLVEFPPTPFEMLTSVGLSKACRIAFEVVHGRVRRSDAVTFADFATRSFGKTLAESFLLNYSSKIWGLPADQLSPAIATRRLAGMNLRTLLTELVMPASKSKHLDGEFLYPEGGFGRIVETLAEALPPEKIRTGCRVLGMECENGKIRAIKLEGGRYSPVSGTVVSTLPLSLMVQFLQDSLPRHIMDLARSLRFRDVRTVFLRLNQSAFSENASIYVPNRDLTIARIYEPKNRCSSMAPMDETGIVVECPCFPEDPVGGLSDCELAQRVVDELNSLGLINPKKVLGWDHKLLKNAYPVYSLGFHDIVEEILESLKPISNLHMLGRNGRFHYSHLHQHLRFAMDFVSNLSADRLRRSV